MWQGFAGSVLGIGGLHIWWQSVVGPPVQSADQERPQAVGPANWPGQRGRGDLPAKSDGPADPEGVPKNSPTYLSHLR